MATQTQIGKAFEYALLSQAAVILGKSTSIEIIEDNSLRVARNCFKSFSNPDQNKFLQASDVALDHLILAEPMLVVPGSLLQLRLQPDSEGIQGDVRDLLFIRPSENWTIGVSAKNNHKAVKHSRLSDNINFGREWFHLNVSENYFNWINPIFQELRQLRSTGALWRELQNKHQRFYLPLLEAFSAELLQLDRDHPGQVPSALLTYLIGNNDFYKLIKRKNTTEVYGFQLHGTLNRSAGSLRPQIRIPKIPLPSRIIELVPKPNSTDTVILTCDNGWQISFRIHNASSRVEPSLKFDINLIGQPQVLYSHHIQW